jgi:hypothetical protein
MAISELQAALARLMEDPARLVVRCLVDERQKEDDLRRPPVVTIEAFAHRSEGSEVTAAFYNASHRDSIFRQRPGRPMGLLDFSRYEDAGTAAESADTRWHLQDRQLWRQPSYEVFSRIKPPVDIEVASSLTDWLAIAHLLRFYTLVEYEIAKLAVAELHHDDTEAGEKRKYITPLSERLAGLVDRLVSQREALGA